MILMQSIQNAQIRKDMFNKEYHLPATQVRSGDSRQVETVSFDHFSMGKQEHQNPSLKKQKTMKLWQIGMNQSPTNQR